MRAFGSDRLQTSGRQLILHCPRPKGWVARKPKGYTGREHPGTAVLWEESYFEVVAEEISAESVRYVLEPWKQENVMRVTDAYDEPGEIRREAERQAGIKRAAARRTANFFGVFTGHLPARVQEELASNLGITSTRLTFYSLILPLLFIAWALNVLVRAKMTGNPPSLILLLLAMYLGLESVIRLNIVWTQSRPIGSMIGFILYSLFYALSPKKIGAVAPLKSQKRSAVFGEPAPPEVALQDAYTVREPILTLLSPKEQAILAERFGYDYRKDSFRVAWVILGFSIAGVVTSIVTLKQGFRLSAVVSLVTAGFLAIEQIRRLSALQRGPTGSVLAVLVRPFARRLFVLE